MSMDIDAPIALPQGVGSSAATILCHQCGAPIDGTTANGAMCYDCIKSSVDVSEGILREAVVHFCKDCERWLQPPNSWVVAGPETQQLLALCLKRLTGLNKVRLTDAKFIWTEPHSRRLRVLLTVQREQYAGTIIQQSFEVVYKVATQQCPDCQKSFTPNTWRAVVQVRQKVTHKRTFLYLEQLILKHGAHKDAINMKEMKDGLDFFFAHKNSAVKFVDFLHSVTPVFVKESSELISEDIHTSKKSYKFSYSCELVPLCKDDLIALPLDLAKKSGNIFPVTLCTRVGTAVNLMDPTTLDTAEIQSSTYWHYNSKRSFRPLADVQELVEFVVLDIEAVGKQKGRNFLAEATIARASDLGTNDTTYFTRTHLGAFIHPGDSVMGYHLSGTNFNNSLFEDIQEHGRYGQQIPDVVLVKKLYQRKKGAAKNRKWRLKRMAKEESEMLPRKQDQERNERDFEMFLRDVEEDEELRQTVALYKQKMEQEAMQGVDGQSVAETSEGEEDVPKINMDELLDDMEELGLEDQ